MLRYLEVTLHNKVGLQRETEFFKLSSSVSDEEVWVQIRELRNRISESENPKPDGERVDTEADLRRSREYSER